MRFSIFALLAVAGLAAAAPQALDSVGDGIVPEVLPIDLPVTVPTTLPVVGDAINEVVERDDESQHGIEKRCSGFNKAFFPCRCPSQGDKCQKCLHSAVGIVNPTRCGA